MHSTKKFPYGKCPFCNKAITHPGLDNYLCKGCSGWVNTDKAYRKIKADKKATKVAKSTVPASINSS